jgi:hypothetical protein
MVSTEDNKSCYCGAMKELNDDKNGCVCLNPLLVDSGFSDGMCACFNNTLLEKNSSLSGDSPNEKCGCPYLHMNYTVSEGCTCNEGSSYTARQGPLTEGGQPGPNIWECKCDNKYWDWTSEADDATC